MTTAMHWGFPGGSNGEETMQCKRPGRMPWRKGMAAHSSVLAWEIPWAAVHGVAKSDTTVTNTFTIY